MGPDPSAADPIFGSESERPVPLFEQLGALTRKPKVFCDLPGLQSTVSGFPPVCRVDVGAITRLNLDPSEPSGWVSGFAEFP
jgi:hypothetical protein